MRKIETRTLHQQVAEQIREMILEGRLLRGQKIDERGLCQAMGVSRTPVRESLRILSSEGLIDLIPHKGAFVRQPPIEEINDMFEVMSVLEGMCARLATTRMKSRDLDRIERLHGELEHHYRNRDHKAYLRANQALHVLIQQLSGNRVVHEVVNGLRQKVLLYRQEQLYRPDRFDQSMEEHRNLLEAFRRQDAALAERVMQEHLLKQCRALKGLYAAGRGNGDSRRAA